MTLTVELQPETMRHLQEAASARGQTVEGYVREVLERSLPFTGASVDGDAARNELLAGIRRRTVEELAEMARGQGARPVERFDDLLGDFWPEDESVDEFIEARRCWQWEGVPDAGRRTRRRPATQGPAK
jgi:hypothetical protein